MVKPLVPKFRRDLSAHLKDIFEKQVPVKLKPIVADPQVVRSPKLPSGQICVSWLYRGPETGYGIHFQLGIFMVPPDRCRYQSGPLTQFTPRRLIR